MHLDSESLRDLGFIKVGQRLRLMRLINELLGLADNFDVLDSHSKLMGSSDLTWNINFNPSQAVISPHFIDVCIGDQLNSECNLWHSVHSQSTYFLSQLLPHFSLI